MLYTDTFFLKFKKITNITITNRKNLKIVLSSIGASIFKCYIGNRKVSYGPRYLVDFMSSPDFYGKTCGRTAGRIRQGIVEINNKTYHLKKGKIHSLHGGFGFAFKNYTYEVSEDDKMYHVKFYRVSPDKENGYPGTLVNIVFYHVHKDEDVFDIEFKAISSKDTICNLTNHTYWNLNGEGKILDHKVFIDASKYVRINKSLLKESIDEVNEVFDFRKEKSFGSSIENNELQDVALGYDHDWILDHRGIENLCSYFISGDEKLRLNVYTTYPVCHIYTNNYSKDKYAAFALELQKMIFNVDDGAVLLKANESYNEVIRYEFIKK